MLLSVVEITEYDVQNRLPNQNFWLGIADLLTMILKASTPMKAFIDNHSVRYKQ